MLQPVSPYSFPYLQKILQFQIGLSHPEHNLCLIAGKEMAHELFSS